MNKSLCGTPDFELTQIKGKHYQTKQGAPDAYDTISLKSLNRPINQLKMYNGVMLIVTTNVRCTLET
jgi:hypothetical protein